MGEDLFSSDIAVLDLLRKRESMTVSDLAVCLDVTATAVRQRLTRLMAYGYIGRSTTKLGRGRPSHHYSLTNLGRRKTGANFADLAVALWEEIRQIDDPEIRHGLLKRIAQRLAAQYADQISGDTIKQKMDSLVELFGKRQIPFMVVEKDGSLPVLNALVCPYPGLAEQDRMICSVEQDMFSALLGEDIKLGDCRLAGKSCCSFEVSKE